MNKIIPTKFNILGYTYKIVDKDSLGFTEGCYGRVNYAKQLIELQPVDKNYEITKDYKEQTYCHELVHILLNEAQESDIDPPLHKREVFVDRVASLLHQVLKTSQYAKNK